MLMEPQAAKIAIDTMKPDDFYVPQHKTLYKILVYLFRKSENLDEVYVNHMLEKRGLLEEIGGRDAIGKLIHETPSAANVEGYCYVVKQRSIERDAITLAGNLLRSVHEPSEKTAAQLIADHDRAVQKIRASADEAEGVQQADADLALRGQLTDEIEGRRFSLDWPGCACLSSVQSLLPDTTTVICGQEGRGKSMFLSERVGLWHEAGIPVALLALEKDLAFNLRRIFAQRAGNAALLDQKWCTRYPESVAAELEKHADYLRSFQIGKVIHCRAPNRPMYESTILKWIREMCEAGKRIIIIDPISKISGAGWEGQKKFVDAAVQLATHYQISLILVTHPKDSQPGVKLVPSLSNISGATDFRRFVDTVIWYEYHEEEMTQVERMNVMNVSTNRTIHLLKTKVGHRKYDSISFWYDWAKLRHEECGWRIPEQKRGY